MSSEPGHETRESVPFNVHQRLAQKSHKSKSPIVTDKRAWVPVEIEFAVGQPSVKAPSEAPAGPWDGILHTSHTFDVASNASGDTIRPQQWLVREM